jgi:hypothetical protein
MEGQGGGEAQGVADPKKNIRCPRALSSQSPFCRYSINKAHEDEVRAYNAKMKPIWCKIYFILFLFSERAQPKNALGHPPKAKRL